MQDIIRCIGAEFPIIEGIMSEQYNNKEAWCNTTKTETMVSEEKHQEVLQLTILALVKDMPEVQEKMKDLLVALENSFVTGQCSMADMAFVEGFRTGVNLILEVQK